MTLRDLRASPTAAWVGPFVLFALFMLLQGMAGSEIAGAPWWREHPEQWVYPLQTITCLAAIAFWWRHYTFRPLTGGMIALAVVTGAVGIAIWVLPAQLYERAQLSESGIVPKIEWLGFTERNKGFNPDMWRDQPAMWWGVVLMRFVRMTIAVPFVEELLWRGFVWRMAADQTRDFWKVPFGARGWIPFWLTTALITMIHSTPDRPAAFVWGLLTGWLYLKTRSVGACVVCHAAGNLLLGLWVMQTGQRGFW